VKLRRLRFTVAEIAETLGMAVGCQNSVRAPRSRLFAGGTPFLAPQRRGRLGRSEAEFGLPPGISE
jgi:hypothetical protein